MTASSFHAPTATLTHSQRRRLQGSSGVYDPELHRDHVQHIQEQERRALARGEMRFILWWVTHLAQLRTAGDGVERQWAAEQLCHPETEAMWEEARELGTRVVPYSKLIACIHDHLERGTRFIPCEIRDAEQA